MARSNTDKLNGEGGDKTSAKFPYTTSPGALRKLLSQIPHKPKPPKFDSPLLKGWGFPSGNDYTMLRVLKAVGLLNDSNKPTDLYSEFMKLEGGSAALADPIKKLYEPLFNSSHEPHKENDEKLKNLFNIHSGGGKAVLQFQIQTFKALCDSADFSLTPRNQQRQRLASADPLSKRFADDHSSPNSPIIQINLHIHLPENKSKSDYESIIEDIGRIIFKTDAGAARTDI